MLERKHILQQRDPCNFQKSLCDQLDSMIRRSSGIRKPGRNIFGLLLLGLFFVDIRSLVVWVSEYFENSNKISFINYPGGYYLEKNCMCVNVLNAKYKARHNQLNHCSSNKFSPVRKSFYGVKHLISKVVCMIVGDGNTKGIWDDSWVPDLQGFIPTLKRETI